MHHTVIAQLLGLLCRGASQRDKEILLKAWCFTLSGFVVFLFVFDCCVLLVLFFGFRRHLAFFLTILQ